MIDIPASFSIDYYERHLENRVCRPLLPQDFKQWDEKAGKPSLQLLVDRLATFCRDHDGYAIAAPQVGLYIRLVVITQFRTLAMINPVITRLGGTDLHEEEACLSLPPNTAGAKVTRVSLVEVEYQDVRGEIVQQTFNNLMARIVQHEVDHLDGCFFINRVGPVARDIVLRKYRKHMRDKKCRTLALQ